MANYRNISMDFWQDSKVVDDFTPEDRYMYLYCMTNPHTNLCGCYEISVKQMANETGYTAGCFDIGKVTVSASYTITEGDKDNLRMRGIVFKAAAAAN